MLDTLGSCDWPAVIGVLLAKARAPLMLIREPATGRVRNSS
jgi:hypothetical protein